MVALKLQPNEKRCLFIEHEHILDLPQCCPVSGNPQPGSTLAISYKGEESFLEVYSLKAFIESYVGGKNGVRSMEGMLQDIAQACADALNIEVRLYANLLLHPAQKMRVTCYAFPTR
jgi:NADPH-dependent 7-cyano-7-deazaguanine reductase QueF